MIVELFCEVCNYKIEVVSAKLNVNGINTLKIIPCKKCMDNNYKQGEKDYIIRNYIDNKLKEEQNIELMNLIGVTDYNKGK